MTEQQPDARPEGEGSDRGSGDELGEGRPDVLAAMAVYSADGQADDETGNDAAAGAATTPGQTRAHEDREPHGPA